MASSSPPGSASGPQRVERRRAAGRRLPSSARLPPFLAHRRLFPARLRPFRLHLGLAVVFGLALLFALVMSAMSLARSGTDGVEGTAGAEVMALPAGGVATGARAEVSDGSAGGASVDSAVIVPPPAADVPPAAGGRATTNSPPAADVPPPAGGPSPDGSAAVASPSAAEKPGAAVDLPDAGEPAVVEEAATSASLPAPVFESSIRTIDAGLEEELRATGTWSEGVPIALKDLRVLSVSYWGFDGRVHSGRLIVNQAWAVQLGRVFEKLFGTRFPIRRMDPVDYLGMKGKGLLASDNTMCFNGRKMRGGSSWSMHAYGLAVDVDPAENPYVKGSIIIPSLAAPYADRSRRGEGMLHPGEPAVEAFRSIGWKWGGDWKRPKDYMHFSSNGK